MNVKNRAFLLVSLVIILLSAFLLLEGVSHFNEEIDSAILEHEKMIDGITHEIIRESFDPYLYKIKQFIEQNEPVREAFAMKDRKGLYDLCTPYYQNLHGENKFFHAMDFNLPDGTAFLRVQKPETFGDNIADSRPIVAAVHRDRELKSGFDIGKHGAIFWVAQPVFYMGDYVGAIEFGIEVKQLEKAMASILGCEVTSVLKGNEWQKADLVEHGFQKHGDHILMTRGNTRFDKIAGQLDLTEHKDQDVQIDGRQHILHSCARLNNYDNESIGRLILFQDISQHVNKKKSFVEHVLVSTFVALFLSFIVIYYSFGALIGRLEEYAKENKKAKEGLQIAHDTLEEKVKERTVELAKSNARLEDEVVIRSRAEIKLGEQRKFLNTLIESLAHPLYVIDASTYEIVLANKAACKITGASTYHGMTCYSMTHHGTGPCSGSDHPCPLVEVKETKRPVAVEHIHYGHDNSKDVFEIHAYPMFNESGEITHIIEYNLNITDRKKSEEEKETLRAQLLASQKMEAVGMLAGGVSHDFNNILTTILGYSQIMALKLEEDNPMREMVEDIYDAAERASNLTRQLLAFSRKQVMEMKVVNLNSVVKNISKMIERLIGENITMRLALNDSIGNVKVDVGQVEQVIMNLAVNARDAMPEGGKLSIETSQVELDEKYTAIHHDVIPGLYTVMTVTDSGKGMSQEVMKKIFEPFYTTKKRGKGTGLGLATVYGIVRQHNGHIYVYSEEGRGTTFKIYLPVEAADVEETGTKETRIMPAGNETILIVDDDEAIRRLIRDTLEPLGYTTFEAGSGEDAQAILHRTDGNVDLVLTDLIMPGMNGQELIEAIQKDYSGVKFILMSGYTDDIAQPDGDMKATFHFVNKPLLPISLANKVREVLDDTG